MNDEKDQLVFASEEPNVSEILKEYERCGQAGDFFSRVQSADDTRLARWDSQSDDGKKHAENQAEGKEPFPWPGASDVRCYQADSVVNEHVAMDLIAFWRSELRITPVGPEDTVEAGRATTFMTWLKNNKLRRELRSEVEYASQWRHTYGWSAVHVSWKREIGLRVQTIRFEQLVELSKKLAATPAEQVPQQYQEQASLLALFPDLIARPESETQAAEVLKMLYRQYVSGSLPKNLIESDIPELTTRRARKAIKELRETQETEIPMPYLCKNQPCIRALKPWRDIVVRNYSADIQEHPHVFLPTWVTESDLRAMAAADEWDSEWVEAAVKAKGHVSHWESTNTGSTTTFEWKSWNGESELIEVVTAYSKQLNEDGAISVYCTILSPHARGNDTRGNLYAKHGLLNYPGSDYPIYQCRREQLDRSITASRGVPELCVTSQNAEKTQHDAIADLTSISVVPPLNVAKGTMAQRYKFGPAVQNQVMFGREPKLMEIPTKGLVPAIEYLELIEQKKNRYFGLFHEDIPPALAQMLQEPHLNRFLSAWGEAFHMAYRLCRKFAPEMVERVTSMPIDLGDESEPDEYDVNMHFDIAMLNPDIFEQKMAAFSALIPEDSEGVLDKGALVRIKASYIDPSIAAQIVTDKGTASEKIFREAHQDFMMMASGNPPIIRDAANDPTASTRLQFARQIIGSNPKYLSVLDPEVLQELLGPQVIQQMQQMQIPQGEPDVMFSTHVSSYVKNLTMGADQQANKIVGRTGVNQ